MEHAISWPPRKSPILDAYCARWKRSHACVCNDLGTDRAVVCPYSQSLLQLNGHREKGQLLRYRLLA